MHTPDRFEAEDRADFDQVLRLALEAPEIREALRRPGVRADAGRLRSQALASIEAISAAAAVEYTVYLRLRAAAGPSAAQRLEHPQMLDDSTGGRGLLAVLAPVLSATASVILLLLGYGLQLADTQQHLAEALVGTGWITAAVAALAALIAAAALIVTAMRHRSEPGGHPRRDAPSIIEAREAWCQALLKRGMLPFLHQQLHLPAPGPDTTTQPSPPRPSAGVPLQQRRTRLGYTSPDFASPDFTGPAAPSRD